jgi:hypothetical protein
MKREGNFNSLYIIFFNFLILLDGSCKEKKLIIYIEDKIDVIN